MCDIHISDSANTSRAILNLSYTALYCNIVCDTKNYNSQSTEKYYVLNNK